MAQDRIRPSVVSAENAVIELSDVKPGETTKKKKRDNISTGTALLSKKLQADAAMGVPLEVSLNGKDTYKNKYVDIEADLMGEGTVESAPVAITKDDSNKTKFEKLGAFKKDKIVGDSKVLDGLQLSPAQRRFVINYCNPESGYYKDKFASFMQAGYSAKNKNVLISNVSKLLGNKKVKEGIARYRKDIITSKKLEISAETVDILRKRATYDVKYFYEPDGTLKPLDKIDDAWRCCIDAVDIDYKGATAQQKLVKYKLCSRDNAIKALNALLEVQQALSDTGASVGAPADMRIQAALDTGTDQNGNQGPRVMLNITVGENG